MSREVPGEHGPERWVADLRAAGWREVSLNVWQAPAPFLGLFRGPYGAWTAMLAYRDGIPPDKDEVL